MQGLKDFSHRASVNLYCPLLSCSSWILFADFTDRSMESILYALAEEEKPCSRRFQCRSQQLSFTGNFSRAVGASETSLQCLQILMPFVLKMS